MLLQDFAESWISTHAVMFNRPSDVVRKRSLLRAHLNQHLGWLALADITEAEVMAMVVSLRGRGLSAGTINNSLVFLKTLLNAAVKQGLLAKAPAIRKLPTATATAEDETGEWLTADQAKLLLAHSAGMSHALWMLALQTGMRIGELLALDVADCNFNSGKIRIGKTVSRGQLGPTKGGKVRYVAMSRLARLAIREAMGDRAVGALFLGVRGGRLEYGAALDLFTAARKASGLPDSVTPHALRHTAASWMVAGAVPIATVSRILGHATIQQTMRYSHFSADQNAAAASVLEGALS